MLKLAYAYNDNNNNFYKASQSLLIHWSKTQILDAEINDDRTQQLLAIVPDGVLGARSETFKHAMLTW